MRRSEEFSLGYRLALVIEIMGATIEPLNEIECSMHSYINKGFNREVVQPCL